MYCMCPDAFQTTQWSLLLSARYDSVDVAREAFDGLARIYWKPLYAYVRRRGHSVEESEDLVQGFFARFIEKDYLTSVSADKGRFRAFLLTCIKRYISDEHDKHQAQKRGGQLQQLSIDTVLMESTLLARVATVASPEAAYDRAWAICVLDEALLRMEKKNSSDGKARLFALLKSRLVGGGDRDYTDLAEETGLTEATLRKKVERVRKEYKAAVQAVVRDSLQLEVEVNDELKLLFKALG